MKTRALRSYLCFTLLATAFLLGLDAALQTVLLTW